MQGAGNASELAGSPCFSTISSEARLSLGTLTEAEDTRKWAREWVWGFWRLPAGRESWEANESCSALSARQ